MDIVINIAGNLVAALIGFCIGNAFRSVRHTLQTWRARRFWRPFAGGDLKVIIGRFQDYGSFEPSGLLGVGDAMALSELTAYFRTLALPDPAVRYADLCRGEVLATNLLVIGGPDVNIVSKRVLAELNITTSVLEVFDEAGQTFYTSEVAEGRTSSDELATDYSIILRAPSPFSPNKQVLLIAGGFGYGTWAGVRFATSKEFLNNDLVKSGQPIECILDVDVAFDAPQGVRLRLLKQLTCSSKAQVKGLQVDHF